MFNFNLNFVKRESITDENETMIYFIHNWEMTG